MKKARHIVSPHSVASSLAAAQPWREPWLPIVNPPFLLGRVMTNSP
ncbi:MAG: hypothetical protein R3B96_16630 [Pirellulaceae bacterium]